MDNLVYIFLATTVEDTDDFTDNACQSTNALWNNTCYDAEMPTELAADREDEMPSEGLSYPAFYF
jgi:hypothetical protein